MAEDLPVVTVQKRKRPSGTGTWRAYQLGADAVGHWLFTPAGSRYRGVKDGVVDECDVAQSSPGGPGRTSVILVPRTGWWVAAWVDGGPNACTADVSTVPVHDHQGWWFEDLELDPYLRRTGTYGCEDVDEFSEACSAGLISSDERDAALAAEAELRLLFTLDFPFVRAGEDWLRHGLALDLPALAAPDAGGFS